MKLIVLVVGGTLLIGAGFILWGGQSGEGKISLSPLQYDAGVISMADGPIKKTYEIKNTGKGDLKINGFQTSCMCTTAVLRVGEKKSPEFGMHDNPAFWSEKISPGQTGILEVTFDPAFHGPQGVGDITRAVYISSNDPQNPKVQVMLMAQVTL